eukprot:scaffold22119_cov45-Phaeocystis_antarctica.AAC.1
MPHMPHMQMRMHMPTHAAPPSPVAPPRPGTARHAAAPPPRRRPPCCRAAPRAAPRARTPGRARAAVPTGRRAMSGRSHLLWLAPRGRGT